MPDSRLPEVRIVRPEEGSPDLILRGRTLGQQNEIEAVVAGILADVRQRGDAALLDSARRFDAPDLKSILVSQEEIDAAMPPVEQMLALDEALRRVLAFHEDQLAALTAGWVAAEFESTEKRQRDGQPRHHYANKSWTWNSLKGTGSQLGQRMIPHRSAGIYVPGGNATYPSSVIMNCVPAQVAGVNQITVTTPARRDGSLATPVLYAARYSGVAKLVKVGGAAAIAALAFGTESVPRVDKIAGPGNRFVNEAKRQLWGQVGLDGFAGPSEVAVLVDEFSNAAWAAADLLTQVEHAPDNAAYLISPDESALMRVLHEVEQQLRGAKNEATMRAALRDHSLAIVTQDLSHAADWINVIAPEHLTLAVRDPEGLLPAIRNAGCILMGEHTPESAGDFCLGPSHTLPTNGAARFNGPVNVLDFLKIQSLSKLSAQNLEPLIPIIETFGAMEGFPTHASGATLRRLES